MDFVKYEFHLGYNQGVEVTLSGQANVKLMTPGDFARYQRHLSHNYYGGLLQISPYTIHSNAPGHYILTIDLGGNYGTLNHSARRVTG